MKEVFLSAGVPVEGRGNFYDSADPFLIQSAVREFVTAALGRLRIVWGGQPAITPMIWAICEDLGVEYASAVLLYQSTFFQDSYPDENKRFGNVEYVEGVPGDLDASLALLRASMLSRPELSCAVFIGGMEGILAEHAVFTAKHPNAPAVLVPAPGGAARQLSENSGESDPAVLNDLNFASLFYEKLNLTPADPRTL